MKWILLPASLLSACSINISTSVAEAEELTVGKICPVLYREQSVGILAFSREWYHSAREDARYIPGDNSTGVGLEIHFLANATGNIQGQNSASCDRYRILQVRKTTARLFDGEEAVQIDVPEGFNSPFYDNPGLEHGYGTHLAPEDDRDKPWSGRPIRASTVAIYDTPFVSARFGIEGEDIDVSFETCVVCQRNQGYDNVLSCGRWGYRREFIDSMSGWSEAEFKSVQCEVTPSAQFQQTLRNSSRIEYSYWINWR
ncbi:hypothetical protein GCM10011352_16290 [Marinobacterium zhoushanense]|uniref:Uncharacterized protein n=1 Tax=Marinobacterium zhoushanense TaxID=1679163 RepID=A0ABQ1KAR1_9GAMM|nr:hypothetical protein [Marinobacterium zhoushanense]GGB90986.1 hypothetical protein GCM10011352_16290 [Marinobacterium zhoushanense]